MPKLPIEILKKRVLTEIAMCQRKLEHDIVVEDPTASKFPLLIHVTLVRTAGPVLKNNVVTHQYTHKFILEITEEYPYKKPLVWWQSEIFHPNVTMPAEGGHFCSKLLDSWGFNSNLLAFIQGVESLLSNPNPNSPWKTNSCLNASAYFRSNPYNPPTIVKTSKKSPKIVGGS